MELIGDDYAQNYVGIRAGGALLVWMRLLQVLYISTNAGLQLLMTISMLFDLGSYFFISLAVLAAQ